MHVQPIDIVVHETLAAADPYYRGPHRGTAPLIEEPLRAIDPLKTRHDLGREEIDHALLASRGGQLPR